MKQGKEGREKGEREEIEKGVERGKVQKGGRKERKGNF